MTRRAWLTRRHIARRAQWGVDHALSIHYLQYRPMRTLWKWRNRTIPISCDCSEAATGLYFAAYAPDPNGFGYNGVGNTSSLVNHLPHIPKSSAKRGDIVVYTGGDNAHAVVLMQRVYPWRQDPIVFSHGSEGGPYKLHLSSVTAVHRYQPIVFLRGIPKDY